MQGLGAIMLKITQLNLTYHRRLIQPMRVELNIFFFFFVIKRKKLRALE